MTIYTVLSPPAETGSAGPDPDSFVFVKEGFCWPALYITAIWLLWRRMWLGFILYLLAAPAGPWVARAGGAEGEGRRFPLLPELRRMGPGAPARGAGEAGESGLGRAA